MAPAPPPPQSSPTVGAHESFDSATTIAFGRDCSAVSSAASAARSGPRRELSTVIAAVPGAATISNSTWLAGDAPKAMSDALTVTPMISGAVMS